MKPKILMDFDGTIFDFNEAFGDFLRSRGVGIPHGFVPDRVRWDEDQRLSKVAKDIESLYPEFASTVEDIFPYEGALEFLKELAEDWELVYCTARSEPNLQRISIDYFNKYDIPNGSLVFARSQQKAAVASTLEVQAGMDDDPRVVISLRALGIPVLVRRAPYTGSIEIRGITYFDDYATEAKERLEEIRRSL